MIDKKGYVFPLILLATISIAFFTITLAQLQSSHRDQLLHLNTYQQALNVAYSVNVDVLGELREKQWANRFFKNNPVIRTGQELFGVAYEMCVEDYNPADYTFNVKIRTTIGNKKNLFYWRQRYIPNMLDFTRMTFPVFFGEYPPELFDAARKSEIDKLVDDTLQNAINNKDKAKEIAELISRQSTAGDALDQLAALPTGKNFADIENSSVARPAAVNPPTEASSVKKTKPSDIIAEIKSLIDQLDTITYNPPKPGKCMTNNEYLMLRDAPWGNIITKIPPQTTGLQVIGLQGDFFELIYNGTTGYSHINWISIPGHTPSCIEPPRPPGVPAP